MPTELRRVDRTDEPTTRQEIATLCGWPELAGIVVIGIEIEARPDGMPKVLMYADTSDPREIAGLLGSCARQISEKVAT